MNTIKNFLIVGIAAVGLAMATPSTSAQEYFRNFDLDTNAPQNTTLGTNSPALGYTNLVLGINTAGNSTNSTLTNTTSVNVVIVGGPSIPLANFYGKPVYVEQANSSTMIAGGTNGYAIDTLDMSPDNSFWVSNVVLFTNSYMIGNTNPSVAGFPLVSGTNVFSPWRFTRWGKHSEAQTNCVTTIQRFRLYSFW